MGVVAKLLWFKKKFKIALSTPEEKLNPCTDWVFFFGGLSRLLKSMASMMSAYESE